MVCQKLKECVRQFRNLEMDLVEMGVDLRRVRVIGRDSYG